MTEIEAKEFIENAMKQSKNALAELLLMMPKVFVVYKENLGEYYSNLENCKKEIQSCEMAIKALEEIQQYREIEREIKEHYQANVDIKMIMKCFIETIFKDEPHEHFYVLTNEDADKWDEYKKIGTLEECQEAVGKQNPFEPETTGLTIGIGRCKCGAEFLDSKTNYCGNCGQKLNWNRRTSDGKAD